MIFDTFSLTAGDEIAALLPESYAPSRTYTGRRTHPLASVQKAMQTVKVTVVSCGKNKLTVSYEGDQIIIPETGVLCLWQDREQTLQELRHGIQLLQGLNPLQNGHTGARVTVDRVQLMQLLLELDSRRQKNAGERDIDVAASVFS